MFLYPAQEFNFIFHVRKCVQVAHFRSQHIIYRNILYVSVSLTQPTDVITNISLVVL